MKFLFTNKDIHTKLPFLHKHGFNILSVCKQKYNLITNHSDCIYENERIWSIIDGYLKDLEVDINSFDSQTFSALSHIENKWPLPSNITGSFSGFLIKKQTSSIKIFSDVIGTYPIYYLLKNQSIYISNSLILIGGISGEENDETGIFQRAVGPYFMNIGSRTIIKNCKRLLPGECLEISENGDVEKYYDNDLYRYASKKEEPSVSDFFSALKQEIKYILSDSDKVDIALSGGLDSRIILGAIPKEKEIYSHTYGKKDYYENQIAEKLAKLKNGYHYNYSNTELYFPEKKIFDYYTINTEAVKFCSWLEILENQKKSQDRNYLLIGDLCEAIPGRNIKAFSSVKYRKRNFFKYILRQKEYKFQKTTEDSFNNWKKKSIEQLLSWHGDNWFKRLNLENKKNEIIKNSKLDLEEVFGRIEAHNIPYTELYDEIFGWFTKSRNLMSQQILICNHNFFAVSPTMSNRLLKISSNIHPNFRLSNRFFNRLFKEVPELKRLGNIPKSQTPLIPQNFPEFIKFPIGGIRSIVDDFLIKQIIQKKNPTLRYRLFKSLNWVKIYQEPGILEKLNSYFKVNALTEPYAKIFYNLAKKRKNLETWPFANTDIISGAQLNLELNMIEELKQENADNL